MASVSSLVQACGANASIPGSNRPPPLAHDSNRISGNARRQAPVQLVHAEDVAVEELALPVGRQREAVRLGDGPVHVPLDVRDRRAREDLGRGRRRGGRRPPARPMSRTSCWRLSVRGRPGMPIAQSGWAAEQLAVRADHLGLDPDPEAEPERRDPLARRPRARRAACAGRRPSRPASRVVVARAEPAVVEDEQLDAEVARRGRDRDQPVGVEVEVGRLPVVDEDRPRPVAPGAARQPLAVEPWNASLHAAEPVDESTTITASGVVNASPGSSVQREGVGLDADPDPGRAERRRPRPRRGSCPSRRG